MRVDDGGKRRIAFFPTCRQVEDGRDLKAVTGRIVHPALFADVFALDPGTRSAKLLNLGLVAQEIIGRRVAWALGGEQHDVIAVRVVHDADFQIRESRFEAGLDGVHLVIHPIGGRRQAQIGEAHDFAKIARLIAEHDIGHVKVGVRHQRFAVELTRVEVIQIHRRFIRETVGDDVRELPVIGETDQIDRIAIADLGIERRMMLEFTSLLVLDQRPDFEVAPFRGLDFVTNKQFAGTAAEQRGSRAAATARDQLALTGAQIVTVIIGLERDLIGLVDDHMLRIKRQRVDDAGGPRQLETAQGRFTDAERAAAASERLFEIILGDRRQIGFGHERGRRTCRSALAATRKTSCPLLAADDEDAVGAKCGGRQELHPVAAGRHHRRRRRVVEIPRRQRRILIIGPGQSDDGGQRRPLRAQRDGLDIWYTRKIVDRNRLRGDLTIGWCERRHDERGRERRFLQHDFLPYLITAGIR